MDKMEAWDAARAVLEEAGVALSRAQGVYEAACEAERRAYGEAMREERAGMVGPITPEQRRQLAEAIAEPMGGQVIRAQEAPPIGPDQLTLAYLLDAVKYLCAGDADTARRSYGHAVSHYREAYIYPAAEANRAAFLDGVEARRAGRCSMSSLEGLG